MRLFIYFYMKMFYLIVYFLIKVLISLFIFFYFLKKMVFGLLDFFVSLIFMCGFREGKGEGIRLGKIYKFFKFVL